MLVVDDLPGLPTATSLLVTIYSKVANADPERPRAPPRRRLRAGETEQVFPEFKERLHAVMWLNERRSHKAKTHHELHLLLLEFVDTLAEPVRDRIRRESEALCSPPAAPPPPPIPWPRGSLRSPLLAAQRAAPLRTAPSASTSSCRPASWSSRRSWTLTTSAARRAPPARGRPLPDAAAQPPSEPPPAPSSTDPLSALLANPAALQAILAAYSPPAGQGAGTPATSSTLVCLVCKKAGKTGKALQHLYRACELLKDKSPEEKGKIIEEAREHFGKSPSRYAPGGKGKSKGKGGGRSNEAN